MGIYLTSLLGIIIGICLILFSHILGDYEVIAEFEEVIKNIGQLSITVSLGSMLMEWFGYVNYTRKRMCEILIEDEVIKVLDMNRKIELKSALIKNIYMYNAPNLQNENNNISTIIDNEMDNILRDYYFEEYIIYIDASILEQNGKKYLQKKMRHTFTAKTINNQKYILESPISTYLKPPFENSDALVLNKFTINNELQNIQNWQVSVEDNQKEMKDTYTKYYTLKGIIESNKKLFTFNDKIDIDFEYTTTVDIDDLTYIYQISKACKHFCIHFNAPNEYKILIEGFGFMSLGNTNKQRVIETENGCMLRFLDWILPGNGVAIIIQDRIVSQN